MLMSSILHAESWSRGSSTPHQQLLHPQAVTHNTKPQKTAAWVLQLQGSTLKSADLTPLVTHPGSSAVSALLRLSRWLLSMPALPALLRQVSHWD